MAIYRILAALDGDMFLELIEAENQAEADTAGRERIAEAWDLTGDLEEARADCHESQFDSSLDSFAVEPDEKAEALATIHRLLDGQEWDAETLDGIADAMRAAGYEIREPDEVEEEPDASEAPDIPADFPVQPIEFMSPEYHETRARGALAQCGTCSRMWDDAEPTAYTPAPSGRCPFEAFHA